LRQQELQLDIDGPDTPADLRQVAGLARAAVGPLRHVELIRQIDEARRAEGRGRARAVEEGEVVRQLTVEEVREAVGLGSCARQCSDHTERR